MGEGLMRIFRIIIFPARFGVVLCSRWFNLAPWISIFFITFYASALNYYVFFPIVELFDDWNTYIQLDAVVGTTAPKLTIIVVFSVFLLIYVLNWLATIWAIIFYFIGACSAKPPAQGDGYELYQRYVRAMIGDES